MRTASHAQNMAACAKLLTYYCALHALQAFEMWLGQDSWGSSTHTLVYWLS